MPAVRARGKPAFFWQAALILLPMCVMMAIAMAAIRQDRSAAEREGTRRAEELAGPLANDFQRAMGLRLDRMHLIGQVWMRERSIEHALWPGSEWRKTLEERRNRWNRMEAEGHVPGPDTSFPSGFQPQATALSRIIFATNAAGNQDNDYNARARLPQPPDWRLNLSPDQLAAWRALELEGAQAGPDASIRRRVEDFVRLNPPLPAQAQAEFIRLRAALADAAPGHAIVEWLDFVDRCSGPLGADGQIQRHNAWDGALSDSGVPLTSLALAEGLQRANEAGVTAPLWNRLVYEASSAPNFFTPMLLDLADSLARKQAMLLPCLGALRSNWAMTERTWSIADEVLQSGRLNGITTTNFWLEDSAGRWLCLLQPGSSRHFSSRSGRQVVSTNWYTEACVYPKAAVREAFQETLESSTIPIPAYLSVSAELEGELIEAPSSPGAITTPGPAGRVLAQAGGRLTSPATLVTGPATMADIDDLPGHPRFTLRIGLARPDLLFAAQRNRSLLFGDLVIAAALTTLAGLFASYQSFRRQLLLSEMKSNFVSSVSHELRAPIASVRLLAESLESGKIRDTARQRDYFRFIVQECRRLSSLVENVLDFARIEQGRKEYEFEPTDAGALVHQTVQLLQPYAEEKGVFLKLETAKGERQPPKIELIADGRAIQQALVNVIDNAIKHSPKGGSVTVELDAQCAPEAALPESGDPATRHKARHPSKRASVRFSVSDLGPGIPIEEHEKIFERFYRRGSELRRETQGVGIGLSIVKHVVEAHGGRVLVRSAVGQGSRFIIELPWNP